MMRRHDREGARAFVLLAASLAVASGFIGGACTEEVPTEQTTSSSSSGGGKGGASSSSSSSSGGTTGSAGGHGGQGGHGGHGGMGGAPDCITNPMTHLEIINACTDAQPIDLDPSLPLLLPDGGLPPLP